MMRLFWIAVLPAATAGPLKAGARYLLALLLAGMTITASASGLEEFTGTHTPTLVLEDLGRREHSLADYRGEVVLLNFWASWCAPCIIEMPSMQRLQEALADRPFTILAVNVGETRGTVWKFLNKVQVHFPLLLDPEGKTAANWQVDFYPSSYLIDPAGRIRYVAFGARVWDAPEMIQAIEELIGNTNKAVRH